MTDAKDARRETERRTGMWNRSIHDFAPESDGFYAAAGDPHGSGDIRCLLCGEQLVFDSTAHWHPTDDKRLARSEWWDKKP